MAWKIAMFELGTFNSDDKQTAYRDLLEQARALMAGERDRVANAANFSALVFHALPDLNWAGFYFFDGVELVVGPFQGKPACVRIALGKGVCGTAAATGTTQLVRDVHEFPGHIACSAETRSEIVVPIRDSDGRIAAVLDIDSVKDADFSIVDGHALEQLCELLEPLF